MQYVQVKQVISCGSKTVEMSARVAALDYLGMIATRLRKETVVSSLVQSEFNDILMKVYYFIEHCLLQLIT